MLKVNCKQNINKILVGHKVSTPMLHSVKDQVCFKVVGRGFINRQSSRIFQSLAIAELSVCTYTIESRRMYEDLFTVLLVFRKISHVVLTSSLVFSFGLVACHIEHEKPKEEAPRSVLIMFCSSVIIE